MYKSLFTKSLSLFASLALVFSSCPVGAAPGAPVAMPDFVKALTPPETLGFVDSYYQGQTEHPILLVQDLHANYGVQQKIEGLLNFYQPKLTAGGHPMVLGIEGAWGKMDLSSIRKIAEKPRQGASDFLLKEAEIGGMEHFAAMSPTPVEFYGIENPEDYMVHRELFRKSLSARMQLAEKIDLLREVVSNAKADGNVKLRHLWKITDDFHSGRLSLEALSKALNVPLSNYGQAEAAIAKAQTAAANTQKGDKAFYMKNVVLADQNLELLARLFRQQLTMEEVQYVAKRVPEMLGVVRALLPGENIQLWQDTVRSAIDHYAIALVRNKPMAEHARDLAMQYPDASPVIVTGGFHTAGIAEDFKAKHLSYIVIAPVVEGQTARDERLYLKRMMGLHLTHEQIANAAVTYSRASSSLGLVGALAIFGMVFTGQPTSLAERAVEQNVTRATYSAFQSGRTPDAVVAAFDNPAANERLAEKIDAAVPVREIAASTSLLSSIRAWFRNAVSGLRALKDSKTEIPVNSAATMDETPSGWSKLKKTATVSGAAVTATLIASSVLASVQVAVKHSETVSTAVATNSSHLSGIFNAMHSAVAMGGHGHPVVGLGLMGVTAIGAVWSLTPMGKKRIQDGAMRARALIEYAKSA